ncbi:MAG: glycosyltransferase family 2 protein [Eisenbergiella massiliensis]
MDQKKEKNGGQEAVVPEKDYKEAYEQEHYKSTYLAGRVAELEDQVDDLQFKLDRIKNNPVWKASTPLRKCMHFAIRQVDRVKNCGSIGGVVTKMKYKANERRAMKHYGTESFPSEEERKRQEETVFPNMVKISILTPLWNTPENFLRDMIGSVQKQTYGNWELCLADGSDDAHAYVGEICRELAGKDERIRYRKLEKNEGIAGNTNQCLTMATGEYIGLFDHDDMLHPCVLFEYVKAINEKNADYVYCDEATFKNGDINQMITMHFKPDYAIDNLRANNYICHFSVFSRKLLDGTELFRTKFDGSQDHDMILRLTDKAEHVVHVPKLLYYWRWHPGRWRPVLKPSPMPLSRPGVRWRIICVNMAIPIYNHKHACF